jgi:hypothetical protein
LRGVTSQASAPRLNHGCNSRMLRTTKRRERAFIAARGRADLSPRL